MPAITFSTILAIVKGAKNIALPELKKNLTFTKFVRDWGFTKPEKSFESVYVHAIAILGHELIEEDVIKLLWKKEVKTAFQKTFDGRDLGSFGRELDYQLHVEQSIPQIKNWQSIPQGYKDKFIKIFTELAYATASPAETLILQKGEENTKKLLDEIKGLKPKKISANQLKEALKVQVSTQLKKQKNSGKYIPKTFIEQSEKKEYIRFFCYPELFVKKLFDEIDVMDFNYLNQQLEQAGLNPFDFKINEFKQKSEIEKVGKYLHSKVQELELLDESHKKALRDSQTWKFKRKIEDKLNYQKSLVAKVALILEDAGQGKTNFVSDTCENFLLKNEIPCLFTTGYEINSSSVTVFQNSIVNKVFPNEQVSFSDFIDAARELNYSSNKMLIIIIDGINENTKPKEFSKSLEAFIEGINQYDFIKILLTCRKEYYSVNFKNIDISSFADEIFKIESLRIDRLNDRARKRLLNAYLEHYKISISHLSQEVEYDLLDNFLLLRIFCEVHTEHKNIHITHIYKEELFDRYFQLKSEEIEKRFASNDELNITSRLGIKKFLNAMIHYMIKKKDFMNVPIDDIIDDPSLKEAYVRFIDENILIRRDYSPNVKFFGQSEVVNFTFDEFRDYLLSKYFLEDIYAKSAERFKEILVSYLTIESGILEGCSTFLFTISKKKQDNVLSAILQEQHWYENAFIKNVFLISDDKLNEVDIAFFRDVLFKNNYVCFQLSIPLIFEQYDKKEYKNLNISTLCKWLKDSSDNKEVEIFFQIFSKRYSYESFDIDYFLDELAKVLVNEQITKKEALHGVFELLPILMGHQDRYKVYGIFEKYHYKYPQKAKLLLKDYITSKNTQIQDGITKFIERYAIKL